MEFEIGKKGFNARCLIGCAGYHGLAPGKKWSTWSPYRMDYPLPEKEAELDDLSRRVRSADSDKQRKWAFMTQRQKSTDPNETYRNTCGNCGLICWEKRDDREKNRRLLVHSGVVVMTADGDRVAVHHGEAAEIDSTDVVRVAVPREPARPAAIPA
jgi:hypothetical protein